MIHPVQVNIRTECLFNNGHLSLQRLTPFVYVNTTVRRSRWPISHVYEKNNVATHFRHVWFTTNQTTERG